MCFFIIIIIIFFIIIIFLGGNFVVVFCIFPSSFFFFFFFAFFNFGCYFLIALCVCWFVCFLRILPLTFSLKDMSFSWVFPDLHSTYSGPI